ncbi:hypothetical protein PSEHALCIP103_03153 [Pseudoalteromonas haloplanktis]|uniref:Uncharacterized protein n=1 Tax=Pseudoalteromonas haloplanktis TaxID=228 RepID=A0A9W4W2F6_PSEHA|nr:MULTISPECIES: hypothetical protein [Pseudoalteromonas]CAH9064466.1 hypothetical protein PSEHALCIP103_03153 [Pseudoalteromonas haloplanktis]
MSNEKQIIAEVAKFSDLNAAFKAVEANIVELGEERVSWDGDTSQEAVIKNKRLVEYYNKQRLQLLELEPSLAESSVIN